MWTYDLSELARGEEPDFGPAPKTAFEKIEDGLKEALEIARGNARPAEERPKVTLYTGYEPLNLSYSDWLFGEEFSSAEGAEERPYLPIHRAMSRMLHADERYENRAFMPGGLLVKEAHGE